MNPEYGTLEDFLHLVEAIHDSGMKCIIDVVYNHTSPDSTLVAEHPDYFYYKPDGCRGNKVGDWTDVVDLNYENRALWQYQIDSLCYWAQYVDGFRCDVASTVPVAIFRGLLYAGQEVTPSAALPVERSIDWTEGPVPPCCGSCTFDIKSAQQAADAHQGHRLHQRRARVAAEGHDHQAQNGRETGHQNRPQTGHAGLHDGLPPLIPDRRSWLM